MGIAGDRDNFNGDISLTAPTGGVTKGNIYLIGNTLVVARETKAAGAAFLAATEGPVYVNKEGTNTFAILAKVYADVTTNHNATSGSTGNTLAGVALEAVVAGDSVFLLNLNKGLAPTAT